MDDTHETAHAQVAPLGRTYRCKACGQTKPRTEEHFHQQWRTNQSGERKSHGWNTLCKPCANAKFKQWRLDHPDRIGKKADRAERLPPVVHALAKINAPIARLAPSQPNLRAILEAEAAKNYEKLATKLVREALGDGKESAGALKLVFSYILGTPREASEDHGPTEFWHTLLASARAVHAGDQTDVGAAADDLGDDPRPD